MSNDGPRFQARKGSGHGCCNDACVVDTLRPTETWSPFDNFEVLAEAGTLEEAIQIAAALNRSAMQ